MIKIHSISGIITNSSSEVFCVIYSEDIRKVEEVLREVVDKYGYSDPEYDPSIYVNEENSSIEIQIPYSYSPVFLKYGIEGLLNTTIGKDNYSIDYDA